MSEQEICVYFNAYELHQLSNALFMSIHATREFMDKNDKSDKELLQQREELYNKIVTAESMLSFRLK